MNELMKYHETIIYIYIYSFLYVIHRGRREREREKKNTNTWRGEKLPKSVNDGIVFVLFLFGGGVSTLRN